jgi:hypothetical protein
LLQELPKRVVVPLSQVESEEVAVLVVAAVVAVLAAGIKSLT